MFLAFFYKDGASDDMEKKMEDLELAELRKMRRRHRHRHRREL